MNNDEANEIGHLDISVLATAAAATHELFVNYVRAGFTEQQALFLTAYLVKPATPGSQPS